jgi:hypothetical protein
VAKEIEMDIAAYNLVRGMIGFAAQQSGIPPRGYNCANPEAVHGLHAHNRLSHARVQRNHSAHPMKPNGLSFSNLSGDPDGAAWLLQAVQTAPSLM